jgi:hypothetical protein
MSKPEDNPDMKILKTATCKTLSGKSTLTYRIGSLPDSTVHLRISKNDGGGMFSDEWVAFEAVQEALKDDTEGAAITSVRLTSLFKGKSVNTPSFLLAALKHLKLVRTVKGKLRHHERLDPRPFLDTVEKLMAGTPTKKPVRKAPTKKAAIKKKALSKRKKATTSTNKTTST